MSETKPLAGTIRKLRITEAGKFRDHLMRLDKDSRRMRFAHGVSDNFIEEYSAHIGESGSIVYGYLDEGTVRAAAELKKLGDTWGREAEAAFSVEKAYQEQGIGSELMGKVIRSARNRGVQQLYLSCLAENAKIQAIARKYDASLRFEYGEVIGEIMPQGTDYISFIEEQLEDRVGFFMTVFDLTTRSAKAA